MSRFGKFGFGKLEDVLVQALGIKRRSPCITQKADNLWVVDFKDVEGAGTGIGTGAGTGARAGANPRGDD